MEISFPTHLYFIPAERGVKLKNETKKDPREADQEDSRTSLQTIAENSAKHEHHPWEQNDQARCERVNLRVGEIERAGVLPRIFELTDEMRRIEKSLVADNTFLRNQFDGFGTGVDNKSSTLMVSARDDCRNMVRFGQILDMNLKRQAIKIHIFLEQCVNVDATLFAALRANGSFGFVGHGGTLQFITNKKRSFTIIPYFSEVYQKESFSCGYR